MICPLCNENIIKVEVLSNDKWSIFCCPVCTNAWTFPCPSTIEYSDENFHGEKKKEDGQEIHREEGPREEGGSEEDQARREKSQTACQAQNLR